MGTLGKFIMRCGVQSQENPLFKEIAGELGITAKYFGTAVESFGITRNLLFHHQRLWMRPMPKSPGLSKDLMRRYRNYDFKEKHKQAQFIALLTISRFLPRKQRDCYLEELENTIDQNEVFSLGIKKPPFPWVKKPANRRRSGKRGIPGNS
jgi:abi-like protein